LAQRGSTRPTHPRDRPSAGCASPWPPGDGHANPGGGGGHANRRGGLRRAGLGHPRLRTAMAEQAAAAEGRKTNRVQQITSRIDGFTSSLDGKLRAGGDGEDRLPWTYGELWREVSRSRQSEGTKEERTAWGKADPRDRSAWNSRRCS
jgi:hypothetical protein